MAKNIKTILNESINNTLIEKFKAQYPTIKYLYHVSPICYLSSIKKHGLGGKMPKQRLLDYTGSDYENISVGVFLADDDDVAESHVVNCDYFDEIADSYEERYDKELKLVVFQIELSDLDFTKLSIDKNNRTDDGEIPTFFYDGVIPFNKLKIIDMRSV